jgi:hypothetical protein
MVSQVKGDGASVVLETCPNIYSLGYLVFAAAGLKQVFGYEEKADTKVGNLDNLGIPLFSFLWSSGQLSPALPPGPLFESYKTSGAFRGVHN